MTERQQKIIEALEIDLLNARDEAPEYRMNLVRALQQFIDYIDRLKYSNLN